MDYIVVFLEGIITFISPCILPMIPIYVTYFMGGIDNTDDSSSNKNAVINSLGFVLGFTIIFVLLGAAAGSFGNFISSHTALFNVISGILMIILGLNYIDIINIKFLKMSNKIHYRVNIFKFEKAVLFGIIFSIGWSPCVGAFLGSALMLAANTQTILHGSLMLLAYSIGLGIPFILSALLIENLKHTFNFIKKHYKLINNLSGIFLILIGIAMISGMFGKLIALFAGFSIK
ncbi:MAG: cytochrome c biogenesis CcdA family protein [Proteocatella sp.]